MKDFNHALKVAKDLAKEFHHEVSIYLIGNYYRVVQFGSPLDRKYFDMGYDSIVNISE